MIIANARTTRARTTGVQRYALELLRRFGTRAERIEPPIRLHGILGHAWEQIMLPTRLKGRLLWSPANSGPLSVEKQVVTLHDLSPLDCPEHLNPRFVAWYRWLIPRLVRGVRRVIADSVFTQERLVALTDVKPEKVVVVPLGVDGRFCRRSESEIAEVRSALGVPTRAYLLALGSLEPRKNLARLISAWAEVQRRLPKEITLVVAGGRGSRRIFQRVGLETLGARVHLTGYVREELVPALYSGALAFIFLSEYEGFGLPPLEAMACGVPVICSNRASLPEVVGDAALLVDPTDLDAIRAALHTLVEDTALRETLCAKSLARARGFSWDHTAEQTWRVLMDSAG